MAASTTDKQPKSPTPPSPSRPSPSAAELRRRKTAASGPGGPSSPPRPQRLGKDEAMEGSLPWTRRNQWVVYAVASGACAAFNGVFAKLTTNDLTAHLARFISTALGLEGSRGAVEVVVRCGFFGLNLAFNGVMWTLFTKALAKGQSTTQVSIMNTSANFVITALLGLAIFAESLPPLWWLGAAMLVAGNVIIGRKDEGPGKRAAGGGVGDGDGDGDPGAGAAREDDDLIAERSTASTGRDENDGTGHQVRGGGDYGSISQATGIDGGVTPH